MLSTLALLVFPLLMAYAASSDLLTMKIANWLVLALVAAYFVMAFTAGIPLDQIGMSVAAATTLGGSLSSLFGRISTKLNAAT